MIAPVSDSDGREEGLYRELDLMEDIAGVRILRGSNAVAEFLGGDAVIQYGELKLRLTLHANHGKLAEGDIEALDFAA